MLKNLQSKKIIVAVIAGWIAVLLSRYSIPLDNLYDTNIIWSLIFPIMIAIAWDWRYALVTSVIGGTFLIPFVVYPKRGYANLIFVVYIVVFLIFVGLSVSMNHSKNRRELYRLNLIGSILYLLINNTLCPKLLLLNNSSINAWRYMSETIINIQALNNIVTLCMLSAIISVLLKIAMVRKLFDLNPLEDEMSSGSFFFRTLISILVFYIIDTTVDHLYTSVNGVHMSFLVAYTGGNVKILTCVTVAFFACDYFFDSSCRRESSKRRLMESEERYRLIYENLIDVYIEIDEDGNIENVSPSIAKLLEYQQEEVIGRNLADFLYFEEDKNKVINTLHKNKYLPNIEVIGRKKNGDKVYILLEGKVSEKIIWNQKIVLIARNITDYVLSEHNRIDLVANLNALFESYDDFVWIVSGEDFSILSYNKKFYDYVYKVIKKKLHHNTKVKDIVRPEIKEIWDGYLNKVLDEGRYTIEYDLDGNGRIFEICFFPIRLYNTKTNIAIVEREITEKKRIEEEIRMLNTQLEAKVNERTKELEEAYHDLESFSHTVSHELKTPIREIIAYIECIEEDNISILPEQSKQDILDIKKVCDDTINLVQDMMYYSKAGYTVLKDEEVDMEQLARESYDSLTLAYENRESSLKLYKMPIFRGDRFLIKQAVFNIMSNSFKYSTSRNKIQITVGCMVNDNEYTYYFHDNGIGFDYSLSGKLFMLFERAHNQLEYDGNGIGLATVKKIVERHGGNVAIMGYYNMGCIVFIKMKRKRVGF